MSRDWVGRVGHSARILRPPHPVGLGNLPDPRVKVGRANPIGLKPDPTVTLQITLSSSSTNKLNLCLVKVFTYLLQFCLNIKYCFDKLHIILNVLLRLLATIFFTKANLNNLEILDLHTYYNKIANLE